MKELKSFIVYRLGELPETHKAQHHNVPDQPQFEGVVFSDGTCVLRWLTPLRSTSVWASFEEAMGVHGHPEYDTKIVWYTPTFVKEEKL